MMGIARKNRKSSSNDRLLRIGLGLVLVLVVLWALLVLNFRWLPLPRNLFVVSTDALEKFAFLGSSYGFLAALFAGIAVVLFARNLWLQQDELSEMRNEMERDRSLQEFIFLVKQFDAAKHLATHGQMDVNWFINPDSFAPEKQILGHEYIFRKASNYLEKRSDGTFFPTEDLGKFQEHYVREESGSSEPSYNPLTPFLRCGKEIARFLSMQDVENRYRYFPLFRSSATVFDFIVMHEYVLKSGDIEFQQYAEECGFFSGLRKELGTKLEGGPLLPERAYTADQA